MYELDYILFQCQHKDYVKTLNVFRFESSLLQRKQQKQKQKKNYRFPENKT